MGLFLIFVGFLFTLNPMLGLLDILPDFIGYLLIFAGIVKLSMISVELNDALGYFKWAAVISVARTLCFIASGSFDETMILCLTMVFAVLEFGVMFFALPLLTDGLVYLNIRYDGKRGEMNEFRIIGSVFFAARGFFSVLPELGALSLSNEDEGYVWGESTAADWNAYSTMLDLVNCFLTVTVAVFFVIVLIKYIWTAYKDIEFNARLSEAYADVKKTDPGRFIRRRLIYAFNILMFSGVFLLDFLGDGKNYIPDFFFALLSLCSVWLFSAYCGNAKRAYITGGAYFVLSLGSWIYSFIFAKNRYYVTYDRLKAMFMGEYVGSIIFAAVEAVALALYIRELIPMLRFVAKNYVGLEVSEEFVRTQSKNQKTVLQLSNRSVVLFAAYCLVAISGIIFAITLHSHPLYWMLHLTINIAAYIILINICSRFISEINMRYEKPGE